MTDYQAYMRTAARGELAVDELLHYGVKGMKWGVRKAERKTSEITAKADKLDAEVARLKGQASQETNPAARKKLGKKIIAKEAEAFAVRNKPGMGGGNANGHDANLTWRQRVKDDKWRQEVNYNPRDRRQRNLFQKSEKYVDKDAIASVNNKPEYKNLDHTKSSPLKAKYDNEMNDIRAKALTDYTRKVYGLNPSKTKQKVWVWNPKTQSFGSEMRAVKHSSDEEDVLEIVAVDYTDDRGRVTGFGFASLEEFLAVAHSELSSDADLFHYGVKGMKWGVRKSDDGGEPRQRGKIRRGITKLSDASNEGRRVMDKMDREKPPILTPERLAEARTKAAARVQNAVSDINSDPRFKGKDIKYDAPLREAYRKEIEKVATEVYREEITDAHARFGVDVTVQAAKALYNYKTGRMEVSQERIDRAEKAGSAARKVLDEARHSSDSYDPDDLNLVLDVEYNRLGHISKVEVAESEISHYGVKGMKWGVRKSDDESGGQKTSRKEKKAAYKEWKKTAANSETAEKIFDQATKDFQKTLDVVNNDATYKGKDLTAPENRRLANQYDATVSALFNKQLAQTSVDMTVSSTGRAYIYQFDRRTGSLRGREYQAQTAKHSEAEDFPQFKAEMDELGHIVSVSRVSSLKHYGVKGMKWGVRRTEAQLARNSPEVTVTQKKPGTFAKATGGTGLPVSDDAVTALEIRQRAKRSTTDALSNRDLQTAITRMNLEQQYNNLAFQSDRRSNGRRFVAGLLGQKRYGKKRPYADGSEEAGEKVRNAIDTALAARRS